MPCKLFPCVVAVVFTALGSGCGDSDEGPDVTTLGPQQVLAVTATGDGDADGTLRWALNQANLTSGDETVIIDVQTRGSIVLTSPLPTLERGHVVIQGNGISISGFGLQIESADNQLSDIVVVETTGHAMHLTGSNATRNTLERISVGAEEDSIGGDGVRIDGGASSNALRDVVVVGCTGAAIRLNGEGVVDNRISGGLVGLRPSGAMVANGLGIAIENGAQQNRIGDDEASPLEIGGSRAEGVLLTGATTNNNRMQNLYIGLRPSGAHVANQLGVHITGGANKNMLDAFVVAGNTEVGIKLSGTETTLNEIQGGYIGLRPSGALVDPNQKIGIVLQQAVGNLIGREGAELHIGGSQLGIQIAGGQLNLITHSAVYGNVADGISIVSGAENQISYNEIRENSGAGVRLTSWMSNNVISRNSIWGNGVGIQSDLEYEADEASALGGSYFGGQGDVEGGEVLIHDEVGAEVELYLDPDCAAGHYEGKLFLDARTVGDDGTTRFTLAEYPQATTLHLTYLVIRPGEGTTPFLPVSGGACPPP